MADFSGGPGFLAFLATLALVVGIIVIIMSMNKHLRKVRTNPPVEDDATTTDEADTTEA